MNFKDTFICKLADKGYFCTKIIKKWQQQQFNKFQQKT